MEACELRGTEIQQGIMSITCASCKKVYKTLNGYNGHRPCPGPKPTAGPFDPSTPLRFECHFCGEKFGTDQGRYSHIKAVHGPKGRDPKFKPPPR